MTDPITLADDPRERFDPGLATAAGLLREAGRLSEGAARDYLLAAIASALIDINSTLGKLYDLQLAEQPPKVRARVQSPDGRRP